MELFDREETFGDDYLYFYQEFLGGERNRADARPHRASPTGRTSAEIDPLLRSTTCDS